MAQKRFISRRITESDKVLALKTDMARFLYCALLPYTDREGRVNANPMALKSGLFEAYPYTVEDIEAAVRDLARVGLVTLYSTERHSLLLEYAGFSTFNSPHAKEPPSDYPGPKAKASSVLKPGDDSGNVPGKAARNDPGDLSGQPIRVSGVDVKRSIEEPPLPPHAPEIAASEDEEEHEELTPYQRAQLAKPSTNHHLVSLFPAAWSALVKFRRVQGSVTEGQFDAWSDAVEDDCRAFGEPRVVEVLDLTTLASNSLDKPFVYYRKVVRSEKAPDSQSRGWLRDDWAQKPSGEIDRIEQLIDQSTAVMADGSTWSLEGCRRCNN